MSKAAVATIAEYVKSRAILIDATLEAKMPSGKTRPVILHEAMRYSVFSGGRRLRPILCLAAAEAVGGSQEQVLVPACAIELFHTYTLIHDDLPAMDNDDERRGKPSSHKKFGEANAILAGDALLTLAFEWLAENPLLVRELAQAGGSEGIIAGQVEDMAAQRTSADKSLLEYIHLNKTAKLFRASVRIGVLAAGGSNTDIEALSEYAEKLGLAYQIVDDIEDADKDSQLSAVDVYGGEALTKAEVLVESARFALKRVSGDTTILEALIGMILPSKK